MNKYQKIYVVGAGAVGCFFGGMLARAHQDVTLIAKPERAREIGRNGLEMHCQTFEENVAIQASGDYSLLQDADLILLCVKSPDTQNTLEQIAPFISRDAVILSLQNGVDNVNIASKVITNAVYPAVAYVACEMIGHARMKHHGRGELLIGSIGNPTTIDQQRLLMISDLFNKADVPTDIATNIERDMWLKFLVNCTYNGLSGIGQMSYGQMVKIPEVAQLIEGITNEFLLIATHRGLNIDKQEADELNQTIARTMSTQKSSTAQDLMKGKQTEIDFLNGLIVALGRQYGIPTPYNESIYSMVKMLEARK